MPGTSAEPATEQVSVTGNFRDKSIMRRYRALVGDSANERAVFPGLANQRAVFGSRGAPCLLTDIIRFGEILQSISPSVAVVKYIGYLTRCSQAEMNICHGGSDNG